MSELIADCLVAVEPGVFPDELLNKIAIAMTPCHDNQIAALVREIKHLQLRAPLETSISQIWRESYLISMCDVLYIELVRMRAIDGMGRLDLGRLRRSCRTAQNAASP